MTTDGAVPLSDAGARTALVRHHYPRCYRTALALTGDTAVARAAAARVLRAAVTVGRKWRSADDADRWFGRYTVIATREVSALNDRTAARDPLLAGTDDPGYTVFVAALRELPPQQREAFLLHHGQSMDLHRLATAMDCSSAAASNHLVAATDALRPPAAGRLGEFADAIASRIARLVPPAAELAIEVDHELERQRRRRIVRTVVRWAVVGIVSAMTIWFAWQAWNAIIA